MMGNKLIYIIRLIDIWHIENKMTIGLIIRDRLVKIRFFILKIMLMCLSVPGNFRHHMIYFLHIFNNFRLYKPTAF